MKIRILVIAMVNSIHTARWLQQFDNNDNFEIILFPSTFGGIKDEFKGWKKLYSFFSKFIKFHRAVVVHLPIRKLNSAYQLLMFYFFKDAWRTKWLVKTIKNVKPDIVHSLEFQSAGYLCNDAKKILKNNFPIWIATNWGSDIYLYSRIESHIPIIQDILKSADFYSAECERDYKLANDLGMASKHLPVIPNSGGLKLDDIAPMRNKTKPSLRKKIVIKGYQGVFGRALHVLQAVDKISDHLKNYEIVIFLASPETEIAADLLKHKTGLNIKILPLKNYLSHDEVLDIHASARIYIGISISDGISTSMLEAMALGAFPIQTCTSCANEWIVDDISGFIVPCDDIDAISNAILNAIQNDTLVDSAAQINWDTINKKAEYNYIKNIAQNSYQTVFEYSKNRTKS